VLVATQQAAQAQQQHSRHSALSTQHFQLPQVLCYAIICMCSAILALLMLIVMLMLPVLLLHAMGLDGVEMREASRLHIYRKHQHTMARR
jgi:hypothetical protein